MGKEYTLIISGRLEGLNTLINECRRNPYAGAQIKRTNDAVVCWAIQSSGLRNTKLDPPVRIDFKWVEQNSKRDPDNIASAKKYILDAIVESGLLPDDGQKYITGFSDEFEVDKKNPRIEVRITEVAK